MTVDELLHQVPPRGVECERLHSNIPDVVASELTWYGEHQQHTT